MSLEQAQAHQKKHGFPDLEEFVKRGKKAQAAVDKIAGKLRGVTPAKMNQTEREFSMILQAQKQQGQILDWRFQGIRLVWGDGMHYKPDFVVLECEGTAGSRWLKLIEVKGAHIFDRDIVRFKGCRAEWKQFFDFEMRQRDKDGRWNRLL